VHLVGFYYKNTKNIVANILILRAENQWLWKLHTGCGSRKWWFSGEYEKKSNSSKMSFNI